MNLVDYWFTHSKYWFVNDPLKRLEILNELRKHFLDDWKVLSLKPLRYRSSNLENILYLDQLSRHFKDDPELKDLSLRNITSNSALFMSLELLVQGSEFLKYTPEQQTFILLPLRHTTKIPLIDLAIKVINSFRESGNRNNTSHPAYIRFLRASIKQKITLLEKQVPLPEPSLTMGIQSFRDCLDPDTYHRPELFNMETRIRKREKIIKQLCACAIASSISEPQYISLSGGVDSMVMSFLLKKRGYNVILLHLVYGNRIASIKELQMIKWWSHQIGCPLYVRHVTELNRNQGDRQFYEDMTRRIRFSFYRQIQAHLGQGPVLLGHIMNDLAENFISNVFLGVKVKWEWGNRGMGSTDILDGVRIVRPFYWIDKATIYQFAQQYNIPYTANSTPEWSRRGKLRTKLLPLIEEIYGKKVMQNIMNFSRQIEKERTPIQ